MKPTSCETFPTTCEGGARFAGLFSPASMKGNQPGSPKQVYTRAVTWDDGQIQTLGQMERASVFFANGQPRCLFAAVGDGPGGFHNMTRSWNVAIPFK